MDCNALDMESNLHIAMESCQEPSPDRAVELGTKLWAWQANHLAENYGFFMRHLENRNGAHGYLGTKLAWMKNIVDELLTRTEGEFTFVALDLASASFRRSGNCPKQCKNWAPCEVHCNPYIAPTHSGWHRFHVVELSDLDGVLWQAHNFNSTEQSLEAAAVG